MNRFPALLLTLLLAACSPATTPVTTMVSSPPPAPEPQTLKSWAADNGNGTYSNPLFYEEFSDPDIIRVGTDYYLAGTTMHAMPGLILLHSKDLINWELASYAFDKLDLAPNFRLQGGTIYGQGIWAPCIRYHDGTFYLFSNVNNHGLHVFRSKSPQGPWEHNVITDRIYDLSVLFDDDGKVWVAHGVRNIFLTQLKPDLTGIVPGTQKQIIQPSLGMGEGLHFYKIKGKYYIVSAIPGGHTPMVAARADTLDGPWTLETLVTGENMGVPTGNTLRVTGRGANAQFSAVKHDPNEAGGLTIHQGGIVDTPSGQWWSIIMQDHNSVGRVSCLAPITWTDGWPLFGLPGNLRKAPLTWIKPDTGHKQDPKPLFVRSDNFDSGKLQPLWQWNHVPDDTKWSLTNVAQPPSAVNHVLRLNSLKAENLWMARNTLTQRAVGPESIVTVEVDASQTKPGDNCGLALLNYPYAWIGMTRDAKGILSLQQYIQTTNKTITPPIRGEWGPRIWLRAHCDYDSEIANFSFSTDGKTFTPFGDPFTLIFQLTTFQGIRYSLFNYNTLAAEGGGGGYADFDNFQVDEPRAVRTPIPYNKTIILQQLGEQNVLSTQSDTVVNAIIDEAKNPEFLVIDRGLGRIALQSADKRHVSVNPTGKEVTLKASDKLTDAETFQWIDMQKGDIALMSLATHRYLILKKDGSVAADLAVSKPDHKDGSCLTWEAVKQH